ncbi:MAG: hypothetical protein WCO68_09985 [Verrucomicrobiota bacterium]
MTPLHPLSAPADFFQRFFQELERQDLPYVILHAYEEMPASIPTDVDFSVRSADLHSIRPIVAQIASQLGWLHVKTVQHEVWGYQFVAVNPHDFREFLQLDVCPHFMRDAHVFISDSTLLAGRRRYNGFYIPAPSAEFAYTLAKTVAKQKSLTDYLPQLRRLWEQEPKQCAAHLRELLGEAFSSLDQLEKPGTTPDALLGEMRARHPKPLQMRLNEWRRILRRMRQPCGVHLAVLGPDGVGKSTLLQNVAELIAPLFRSLKVLHFRPAFFERKTDRTPTEQPHAQRPRGTCASWLKVLYYAFDHWCGYLLQQRLALATNHCVLFDRNFDDLLIDPVRYRLQNSRWLIRLLRPLLPKPALTFILSASPEVIHQRKPELSQEEIARQLAAMQSLAATSASYQIINAQQPAAQVATEVISHLTAFLARREQKL